MNQDLAKAKQLITDAGAAGKSITIGMSSELTGISIEAAALKAAAEAIGMKGHPSLGLGAELHQLLHRPQSPCRDRRLLHAELR